MSMRLSIRLSSIYALNNLLVSHVKICLSWSLQETYNDETRLKTTVYEAKKFDPVQYGNVLSQQIDELAEKLGI